MRCLLHEVSTTGDFHNIVLSKTGRLSVAGLKHTWPAPRSSFRPYDVALRVSY